MAEISKTRRVVKIDVDEFPDLASMFNVFSVPTVILLDGVDLDGGAELGRFPGARSQEFVEDFIASLA
jgi:thioredoxin-like negative regulator of GroEL